MGDNVIDMFGRPERGERDVTRCVCGSGWFTVTAVCIETDGRIGGYSGLPLCYDCKRPIGDTA